MRKSDAVEFVSPGRHPASASSQVFPGYMHHLVVSKHMNVSAWHVVMSLLKAN